MPVKQALKAPSGAFYLVRAIKTLFSDWKIFRLAIMPMFINIVAFRRFFCIVQLFYLRLGLQRRVFGSRYGVVLGHPLLAPVAPFYLLFRLQLCSSVLSLLALLSPPLFVIFYSAAVERKLTGSVEETEQTILEMGWFIVKNESKKVAIILFIQITIALIAFIPVVGQVAFIILTTLFLSAVMAFEFTGYTLDRRGLSFKEKRA